MGSHYMVYTVYRLDSYLSRGAFVKTVCVNSKLVGTAVEPLFVTKAAGV